MKRIHEYDIESDIGIAIESDSPCPGRVKVLFALRNEQKTLEMSEEFFEKVVRKYVAARTREVKAPGASAPGPGSRAARAAEPKLDDL